MVKAWCGYVTIFAVMLISNLLFPTGLTAAGVIVMTIFPAISYAITWAVQYNFSFKATMPDSTALGGEPLSLQIKLENKLFIPCPRVAVRVRAHNCFLPQQTSVQTIAIPLLHKNACTVTVPFEIANCGALQVEIEGVWLYDILGLTRRKVPYGFKRLVMVAPKLRDGVVPELVEREGDSNTYADGRHGNDHSEVLDYREYSQGDSIKDISWKLSSRMDNMMVKEYAMPISANVLLLVELCRRDMSNTDTGELSLAGNDAVLSALMMLTEQLTHMSVNYTVMWFCGKTGLQDYKADITDPDSAVNCLQEIYAAALYDDCMALYAYEEMVGANYANSIYITADLDADSTAMDCLRRLEGRVSAVLCASGIPADSAAISALEECGIDVM